MVYCRFKRYYDFRDLGLWIVFNDNRYLVKDLLLAKMHQVTFVLTKEVITLAIIQYFDSNATADYCWMILIYNTSKL